VAELCGRKIVLKPRPMNVPVNALSGPRAEAISAGAGGATPGWNGTSLMTKSLGICTAEMSLVRGIRRRGATGPSAAIPEPSNAAVPVGDAALARDALASQGVSIGLSDACLIADTATTLDAMARRRKDAIRRHFRHLIEMATTCRYADAPCWSEYLAWLGQASTGASAEPTTALAHHGAH
jgi:hypothetical protein